LYTISESRADCQTCPFADCIDVLTPSSCGSRPILQLARFLQFAGFLAVLPVRDPFVELVELPHRRSKNGRVSAEKPRKSPPSNWTIG
jgi:hypothetical protein